VLYDLGGAGTPLAFALYGLGVVALAVALVRGPPERRRSIGFGAGVGLTLALTPFAIAIVAAAARWLLPRNFRL
jgi:hypothetical protein